MRAILLFCFLIIGCSRSSAQELRIEASYEYLYSVQLDKAIQTYNFSRPFLAEKQPLLVNGIGTSISYVFKNANHFKHGISLTYTYFRSSAENDFFNNTLNLHFAKIGYILHYGNTEKWKGFYSDLTFSATSSIILRNVNGEPFVYDETSSKALGIGGQLQLKFGHYFHLKNTSYLSPFISFGYTPYLYCPNDEAVINQTKGVVGDNWTSTATGQVGVAFHIRKPTND